MLARVELGVLRLEAANLAKVLVGEVVLVDDLASHDNLVLIARLRARRWLLLELARLLHAYRLLKFEDHLGVALQYIILTLGQRTLS